MFNVTFHGAKTRDDKYALHGSRVILLSKMLLYTDKNVSMVFLLHACIKDDLKIHSDVCWSD